MPRLAPRIVLFGFLAFLTASGIVQGQVLRPIHSVSDQIPTAEKPAPSPAAKPTVAQRLDSPKNESSPTDEPSVVTELISSPFVNVHQETELQIRVHNRRTEATEAATLNVTLPPHVEFVSANPPASHVKDGLCRFELASLRPNERRTLHLRILPQEKQPIIASTQLLFATSRQIGIDVRQPQLEMHIEGNGLIVAGQKQVHAVKVTNSGDGPANDMTITASYPEGIRPVDSRQNRQSLESLAPSQSHTFRFETDSEPESAGKLSFTLNSRETTAMTKSQVLRADNRRFQVDVRGPKRNYLNRDGIYSVEVYNPSDVDLKAIDVKVAIPLGLNVTTLNRHAALDGKFRTITWTVDSIKAGERESFQWKATHVAEGPQRCQIEVRCQGLAKGEYEVITDVRRRPDVNLSIRCLQPEIQHGRTATLEILVSNDGTQDSAHTAVTVALPARLRPLTEATTTWNSASGQVSFPALRVASGQQRTLSLKVTGHTPGLHVVRASVQRDSQRPIVAEDSILVFANDDQHVSHRLPETKRR